MIALVVDALAAGAGSVAAQEKPATGATTNPPPAVAPAPLADPRAATDQLPGGAAIQVTVGNGFLTQRLPFDIPFYITGSAANELATRVELVVYRLRRSAGTAQFVTELSRTYNCELAEATVPVFMRSQSAVAGAGRSFNLLIDPLEPQRYYVFCFISAGAVPLAEIEAPIRAIFADTVTTLVPTDPQDLEADLVREIHRRLRDEINRVGARRRVPAVIPAGNIFNDPAQVAPSSDFTRLVIDLINPYRNLADRSPLVLSYQRVQDDLRKAVDGATGEARNLLAPLRGRLPLQVRLPSARNAFISTAPLTLSAAPFNVDDATAAIDGAVESARASKQDAVVNAIPALLDIREQVLLLKDVAQGYARQYERLSDVARRAIDFVVLESRQVSVSLGSTVLGADLSRNAYVSLDAGIAYPWRLENLVFYAGTNIYFRPINKDAPLRDKGTFLHRFAVTIGVTTTVKDDSRRAIDLRATEDESDTSNSLLLGGGIRVTPSMRLGVGALVFKESHSNPLIKQTSVRATPYVSFAADVNVAEVFKSFFP